MSGKYVLETKQRLTEIGLVNADTRYFVNHFSHNGHGTHAQLEEYYNPHGIEVAFDGLEICL